MIQKKCVMIDNPEQTMVQLLSRNFHHGGQPQPGLNSPT